VQVTVTIHEAWFARPEDLRRVLALLAGLEVPPPGMGTAARPVAVTEPHDPREDLSDDTVTRRQGDKVNRPAGPPAVTLSPPHRVTLSSQPDRGDAWEPPADDDDQNAPTNGRQLLGWASKQVPDLKGTLLSFGKRNGLKSKIVDWTPEQVRAAYRFARGTRPSTGC
jgi:hypothetical protein